MEPSQRIAQLTAAFEKWVSGSTTPHINYKITEARIGGWISIEFEQLNVEQMEVLCRFIRKHFTVVGKYTHILPKFGISQGGYPALTFGGNEIDTAFPLN